MKLNIYSGSSDKFSFLHYVRLINQQSKKTKKKCKKRNPTGRHMCSIRTRIRKGPIYQDAKTTDSVRSKGSNWGHLSISENLGGNGYLS